MELQIFTLNCWGLWLVAKQRARRLRLIGEALQRSSADVVHLQEVWCRHDADLILAEAAKGQLKHGHHFIAGHFGSGLVTLSRFPLKQARFIQFTAAGDPLSLKGDFFAGKGVGWTQLETPAGLIDTFNTHLSANYRQSWQDAPDLGCRIALDGNSGVRILQMQQLATFVNGAAHPEGVAVVVAGDLNNPPDSLHMCLMQDLLPDLRDSWAVANPKDPGPTANDSQNTYSTAGAGKSPTRIDYVWASSACQVLSAEITMKAAAADLSFSDHFGVSVRLQLPAQGCSPGSRQHPAEPQGKYSSASGLQAAALHSMQRGILSMQQGSLAQAGVQSDSPQRAVNLPERAIEMPVSAARFGRIRSGRLGADSEGSDSSAASSPAKSRSTGSTMAGKIGVVPIREFMSPGESPLGAIRAGRLGE
ncbi:hypothetical protein WJX84_005275 [Apatococcus fuscideae]|uniref:Endonuclease/exonuclease/phosphatase domain-containing protein n=1 Tax=Apatococcus fuscideae TaxID=2026836 RepID=A0AAW1TIK8_9CHLO